MSDLYRLEVCSRCNGIQLGIIDRDKLLAMRNRSEHPEYVSGKPLWRIEQCDRCQLEKPK